MDDTTLVRQSVRVCAYLAGDDAIQFGTGPVFVSQHLFDRLRRASSEELTRLLTDVKVRVFPPVEISVRLCAEFPIFPFVSLTTDN